MLCLNPVSKSVLEKVPHAFSAELDKAKNNLKITRTDGSVINITVDSDVDNALRVLPNKRKYYINARFGKAKATLDMSEPIGNTFALLNRYGSDFKVNSKDLTVFLNWTREDIVDFLANYYNIINEYEGR